MLVAPGSTKKFTKEFDLLGQVQDEDVANLKLTVWNVTTAWGTGVLLRQKNGKLTGVWRFVANAAGIKVNSVLAVRYNVTDTNGAVGAGVFYISFSGKVLVTLKWCELRSRDACTCCVVGQHC
jgi:hypothetical protein